MTELMALGVASSFTGAIYTHALNLRQDEWAPLMAIVPKRWCITLFCAFSYNLGYMSRVYELSDFEKKYDKYYDCDLQCF